MDDLPYFFAKPGILDSEPVLFLFLRKSASSMDAVETDDISGAVLMYEYRFLGVGLKALAVIDRAGGAVIARLDDRIRIVSRTRDILMRSGIHIAMLSVDATDIPNPAEQMEKDGAMGSTHQWKLRHRKYPAFLEMQPTLDETLATIHQKTRFNLRYYRRRAEKELGSVFLPEISLTDAELFAFNRQSSHPVPDAVLRWRLRGQELLRTPVLVGVKDRNGEWLSILAARRNRNRSEILWQMNRSGLPQHSIGTVMRSYFLENEIEHGVRRLYVDQGTPHLMKNSFVPRDLYDLVLVRRSIRSLLQKLTRTYLHADNPLAELLQDDSSEWHSYGVAGRSRKLPSHERRQAG